MTKEQQKELFILTNELATKALSISDDVDVIHDFTDNGCFVKVKGLDLTFYAEVAENNHKYEDGTLIYACSTNNEIVWNDDYEEESRRFRSLLIHFCN